MYPALSLSLQASDWQFERRSEITFQTLSCAPLLRPCDARNQSPELMLIDQKKVGWQVTKR